MADDLNELLESESKKALGARGLSRLYRIILADLKVAPMLWNKLMLRYLNDPRNGVPNNSKDRSSHRGNLNKELRRPDMTWKVFTKGLRFLGPKWYRITIDLGWESGKVTSHTLHFNVNRRPVSQDDEDDPQNWNPVDPGHRTGIPVLDDPDADPESPTFHKD